MRIRSAMTALAVAAAFASAGTAAAAPSAGMLSNACAGCHGTNGCSAGPSMPSLASQTKTAIRRRLALVASGGLEAIGSPAEVLTDERIERVYGVPVELHLVGGRPVVVPTRGT